jgi:hypothetical protein
MKLSKTDHQGGEALTLATKSIELTVTTSVGPRVVSFKRRDAKAKNVFWEMSADAPRLNGYLLRGGHRLWHSPEHPVRSYQPDDEPLAVKPLSKGIALAQPVEANTGMQKAMKIELVDERTVRVTHALTNQGLWPVECAAWALTMLRSGGYGVVPLSVQDGYSADNLLPGYALVPWTYTDLSLPVWELNRNFIGINVSKAKEAQKIGLTNYAGWSAYWIDGVTFVKYSPVIAGATYPDLGCAWESFTNGKMIELETLSPLRTLAPGDSAQLTEHWTLLEGLAKPSTPAAFGALSTAVGKWLKTFK